MASLDVTAQLEALPGWETDRLRNEWRRLYRAPPPKSLSRDLLIRGVAYKLQENAYGGLTRATLRLLVAAAAQHGPQGNSGPARRRSLKPGARLIREWGGETHTVLVTEDGFEHRGQHYDSLSQIARLITGAHWSGPRFFGLTRAARSPEAGHE